MSGQHIAHARLMPVSQVKQRAFPIGRTHLQRMLLDKAGRSNVHLGRKAMNYHIEKTGVTLELEDGHIDTGDFLVIADVGLPSVEAPRSCPFCLTT